MEFDNKTIIKVLLISLPFAFAFAIGVVYMEFRYPEALHKIIKGAAIVFGIVSAGVALYTEDTANTGSSNKRGKSVSRPAVQSSHKSPDVPYGDINFDTDDDEDYSESESRPSTEFRHPIGMIPDPYDPQNRFKDYYGHEYDRYCGVWRDDNGNLAPGYMYDWYGLTDYEKQQEDDY